MRGYALHHAYLDPDPAPPPEKPAPEVLDVRNVRGGNFPDCRACAMLRPCHAAQSANYRARKLVHPFARPECETAFAVQIGDIEGLLRAGPRTLTELCQLTGYTYPQARRRVLALREQGVNIVAYLPHNVPIYGYGPSAERQTEARMLILQRLRDGARLTAVEIGQAVAITATTARHILADLESAGKVYRAGETHVVTCQGKRHLTTLWAACEEDAHG